MRFEPLVDEAAETKDPREVLQASRRQELALAGTPTAASSTAWPSSRPSGSLPSISGSRSREQNGSATP